MCSIDKSIDKVSRYFWYRDTKKYRGTRNTSIVKFWYRDISKYRQYRPSLIVMSHDSAKHKQNGVNYIRSESSNRLVPVALYGQVIEWSQNRLYIMTRRHWVTGPESHYSDTQRKTYLKILFTAKVLNLWLNFKLNKLFIAHFFQSTGIVACLFTNRYRNGRR